MSTPIINTNTTGPLPVIAQAPKYNFNVNQGFSITEHYEGTKAAILALAATFRGWNLDYGAKSDGPVWELTARLSFDATDPNSAANIIDDWSYLPGKVGKDILHADTPFINSIPEEEKQDIAQAIAANATSLPASTITTEITDAHGNAKTVATHAFSVNGKQLFGFMRSGQKEVLIFAPTIKHTMTVSNLYSLQVAGRNANKVLTTIQLQAFEDVPDSILVDLPNDVYTGTLPLAYGWYKSPPEKKQSAFNKLTIEQEWQYGLYSPLVYNFV